MNYSVLIKKEKKYFVAENIELWIFSQWKDFEEAIKNIKEATELYLQDNPVKIPKLVKYAPVLTTISA